MVISSIVAAQQQSIFYMFINRLHATIGRIRRFLLRSGIGGLAALLLAACGQPAGFHATDITGANFGALAALERLTDHAGRRPASADFAGKAVVVFFGYTQCPDICPTNLTALREALRLLGPAAERVVVLFVSVDPDRDTQEVLANYVPWFDPRFRGLRADPDTLRAIAQEFKVFYARVPGESPGSYSIDHTASTYAYDPQGRLRLLIAHGATPREIADDLGILLAGK